MKNQALDQNDIQNIKDSLQKNIELVNMNVRRERLTLTMGIMSHEYTVQHGDNVIITTTDFDKAIEEFNDMI